MTKSVGCMIMVLRSKHFQLSLDKPKSTTQIFFLIRYLRGRILMMKMLDLVGCDLMNLRCLKLLLFVLIEWFSKDNESLRKTQEH